MHAQAKEEAFEGFSIFSSGGQCSMAQNSLSNFSRELPKEPSCEIISKSVHRFCSRSRLKLSSIYSPGGHFVQRSGTI